MTSFRFCRKFGLRSLCPLWLGHGCDRTERPRIQSKSAPRPPLVSMSSSSFSRDFRYFPALSKSLPWHVSRFKQPFQVKLQNLRNLLHCLLLWLPMRVNGCGVTGNYAPHAPEDAFKKVDPPEFHHMDVASANRRRCLISMRRLMPDNVDGIVPVISESDRSETRLRLL